MLQLVPVHAPVPPIQHTSVPPSPRASHLSSSSRWCVSQITSLDHISNQSCNQLIRLSRCNNSNFRWSISALKDSSIILTLTSSKTPYGGTTFTGSSDVVEGSAVLAIPIFDETGKLSSLGKVEVSPSECCKAIESIYQWMR